MIFQIELDNQPRKFLKKADPILTKRMSRKIDALKYDSVPHDAKRIMNSMIGKTKNRHSRRTIKLIPVMMDALKSHQAVYDKFKCEYFFFTENGCVVDSTNLRERVWKPALKKAGLLYREMKQTRHSFTTNALSCGESPLWIAKVMGHRDTDMIIRVYSKFIEDARGIMDGSSFDAFYRTNKSKNQ